jgi:hypothetical protein
LETENNKLKTEIDRWHSWYDTNSEILEKLFKSVASIRKVGRAKKERTTKK